MKKAVRRQSGARDLVRALLEEPGALEILRGLEAPVLARLIRHVGLEDSAEVVSLATAAQLAGVLDEDLWQNERPGREEQLDAERFALWLEVLQQMGSEAAAEKIAALDEDFVAAALASSLLVLDVDELLTRGWEAGTEQALDERTEKALESSLTHEMEGYLIVARRSEGWNALIDLLVTLDANHGDVFRRLMRTLVHVAKELADDNGGLWEVLSADEQLQSDVAFEREQRRARKGFLAPEAAAHFLELARRADPAVLAREDALDALTRGYFRDLDATAPERSADFSEKDVSERDVPAPKAAATAPAAARMLFLEALADLEIIDRTAPQLAAGPGPAANAALREALRQLAGRKPALYERRMQELGYLANVLVAGCALGGGRFRPVEAGEAALAIAGLGLEAITGSATALDTHDAVKLFRVGWSLLQRELAAPLRRLVTTVVGEAGVDALESHFAPADAAVLRALLDECPWIPGAAGTHRFFESRAAVTSALERARAILADRR